MKKVRQSYDKFRKQGKEKETNYLQAAKIVCEAMTCYIKRYADKAKELAKSENNLEIKKIYEKVAKACDNISINPPSNFYEALLWTNFYVLVDRSMAGPCDGFARQDMFLEPFYYKDIESKRITEEEAQELIAEFMLKRPYWYCIGGRDKNLKDATNKLSWLSLNACNMFQELVNLAVLWHEDIDKNFLHQACEVALKKRSGVPIFMNHDVMRKSAVNYGIKEEDAWNVAYNGCAWYGVIGKEYLMGDIAGVNLLMCLMKALDLAFKIKAKNFNELWELFLLGVEEAFKALKDLIDEAVQQYPLIWPEILPSLLSHGCIEKGRDVTNLGVQYNFPTIQVLGVANVADSLVAIKKTVFDEKRISLEDLEQALNTDFEGHEYIHHLLLNCPKFGNDNDEADEIAEKIVSSFSEILSKYKSRNGFAYRPAIWSHVGHVYAGKMIGATPDGRKAGEQIAQGPNPMHGKNVNGISATAKSIAKLKPERLLECAYQLEIDPSFFQVKDKVKLLEDIITSCFKIGITQVNTNIVLLETLKEAMIKPDKYRHLMVRVSGFSARFVELTRDVQEEIIRRYRQSVN